MSEIKHTPGPWECQSADDNGEICIIGANLGGLVGAAHCWPTEFEAGGSDRVRANARLIAAAPELLDALAPFAAVAEHDIGDDEADAELFQVMGKYNRAPKLTVSDFRRALAIIAKAKGAA